MAFGYIENDTLIIFTFKKELGYGRGKSGNWWALQAIDAIADGSERLEYSITRWSFPAHLQMAIERILQSRGRPFEVLASKSQCDEIVKYALMKGWQEDHRSSMANDEDES